MKGGLEQRSLKTRASIDDGRWDLNRSICVARGTDYSGPITQKSVTLNFTPY